MKKLTIIGITLGLLLGVALWQQQHIVVGKAAPMLATQTVTTTADSGPGSLRQAIVDAASVDTIDFSLSGCPCTITLTTGELLINKSLTILGPGASQLTVSGNNASRVFFIDTGNTVTLDGLTVTGGNGVSASFNRSGGGILNNGGTLTLTNSTVSGNSAFDNGGGIYNFLGTLTLTNSTVSGNSTNVGGGIINDTGTLTLTNSTVSGNSSSASGGGMYIGGTVTLTNSTITGNRANLVGFSGPTGGGIYTGGISTLLVVNNTIVAGNFLGTGTTSNDINGFGMIGTANNNLIGDAGSAGGIANGVNGNIVGVAVSTVLNTTLADNGGPTKTHALVPGSPALNAGSNALLPADAFDLDGDGNTAEPLPVDQRGAGFPRVADTTVDIGAFEGAARVVTKTDDTNDGTCDADCSLREAIAAASAGDTILFSSLFNTPQTIILLSQLVINKNLTILGTDASKLTVSGNNTVRVFRIIAGNFNVTISDLTIANGSGGDEGGGILNESVGTLNVTNCTISGNSVARAVSFGDAEGGGIANEGTGTLNVTNCTISGNSAGGSADALGGGIANVSHSVSVAAGTVNITNSTISGNSAITSSLTHGGVGGGVFNQTGTVNVTNSTVAGNSASGNSTTSGGQGGGIYNFSSVGSIVGTVNVKSTIIALNTASVSDPDVHGAFTSQGYNLIGNGSGGSGFSATGDQVNVANPGLELNMGQPFLKDNGGPTRTIALVCDSPAIDKGKNFSGSTTDQRGAAFVRTFDDPNVPPATDGDNTDIGAFEMQQVCNTNPTITGGAISRQQGVAGTVSTIATVGDLEDPAGSLTVTVTSLPAGITVSGLTNTNGAITANVSAACNATLGNNTVGLKVEDSGGLMAADNLIVTVTANTPPTLSYNGPVSVLFGLGTTVNPATGPSDNGSIATIVVQSPGTYTGTISVDNSSGVVSISNAAPIGSHTITIRATDNCGAITDAQFTLVVNSATKADLEIEKSDSDPVLLGNNITYKIEVENEGPGNATGVKVIDTLPAGVTFVAALSSPGCIESPSQTVTCTIGNLAKDKEAKRTIVGHPTVAGTFTNTARVTADQPDPKLSNNTDNESTRVVVGVASLTLSPTSVKGGSSVIVTGTVTLSGAAPSGGQVVTLSSSSTSVAKPAVNSITIPSGSSIGTFPVNHFKVSSTKTAKIKASANGFSREATLTVTKN